MQPESTVRYVFGTLPYVATLNLRLPDEVKQRWQAEAHAHGLSLTAWLRTRIDGGSAPLPRLLSEIVEREAPLIVRSEVERLVAGHVEEMVERHLERNAFSKDDLRLVASEAIKEYLDRRFASGDMIGALAANLDADGHVMPEYE